MLQIVYAVPVMERTTKYTATTTHLIGFNMNFLMHGHRQPTDLMMSSAIGNLEKEDKALYAHEVALYSAMKKAHYSFLLHVRSIYCLLLRIWGEP